ncbi:MAG: glycosyltransferase [Proteobacteria bacterium]|nr:glycosyltransferase [Pseudomonadota bacterium]
MKSAGKNKITAFIILPFGAILITFIYLIVRTFLFIAAEYMWYEKTLAFFLLLAETFILVHGIGYFLEIIHVTAGKKTNAISKNSTPPLTSYPPVAIIVSSFKEPIGVIENTLISFYNLTYPNKHIYFLDDTRYNLPGANSFEMNAYRDKVDLLCQRIGINLFRRKWRGAKAGMINDFLDFLEGRQKEGFSFQNFGGREKPETEKYIIVFDADQNPFPNFVEALVQIMEQNSKLAFIQTPQYYTNFETNCIARAAGLQQVIFYEYICEGKSLQDAMFCCGTNVIFRREALTDVGGFDESSVTEDFATSLKFHLNGWRSAYLNEVMAFGMGPEDLGGYFKQQFRWALGTVGLLSQVIKLFVRNPKKMTTVKWWEYLLSSTHYFIGPVFLILVSCPVFYLFFNVPSYFARPEMYILIFTPYIIITVFSFFWTLKKRNYRAKDIFTGQLLMAITFPVYIKASILALLGVRGTFVTTPKGESAALPLKDIWVQVFIWALSFAAIIWGLNRLYYERYPAGALIVNMLWCLYHFLILSSIFYFNKSNGSKDI